MDVTAFADCVNATNSNAETPLHLAAQGGEVRSVEILLSHGALTNRSLDDTAFMCACRNGHHECALLLYNAHPFQRDWKDKVGNTALHHAALGGCPKTLGIALDIESMISRNEDGLTFLDIIISSANERCALVVVNHRRWQECLEYPSCTDPMIGFIQQLPTVAKRVLDRCHQCASVDSRNAEYWEKFVFKYLQPQRMLSGRDHPHVSESVPTKSGKEVTDSITALKKMVRYKRLDLLVHPVVEEYISSKWNTYGLWVYMVSFLLRLTTAILLSTFVLVVPHPDTAQLQTPGLNANTTNATVLNVAAQTLRVATLLTNFLLTLLLLLPLTANIKKLLTKANLPIIMYSLAIVCTYVFLLAPNPTDLWTVGALASFFCWLAVIMGMLFFEMFGIYVKMFLTVTLTVFKVLFVSFFLILAFAFPFHILAARLPFFASISYSLFTLFSYLLGEVQYELIVVESQSDNLSNSPVVFLFVITVAILMTISMANLLVGLAVGDIEGIRSTALLEKRKLHVLYLSYLERSPLFRRFRKPYVIIYPNRKASILKRLCKYLKNVLVEDEDLPAGKVADSAQAPQAEHTSCVCDETLRKMGQQLEELTHLVNQITERQARCCSNCQEKL